MSVNMKPQTAMELNGSIAEYDIKSANTSLMEYYNLLDKTKIDKLNKLPKEKREVAVGLLMQYDRSLATALEEAFDKIIDTFISENGLDVDTDVLSIKKDAVFVLNKRVDKTEFGPVKFIKKNDYHSFIQLGNYEFYIGNNTVDVKGLKKQQSLHNNGILYIIKDFVGTVVSTGYNRSTISTYLSDLVASYKNKELELDAYREFNTGSAFKVIIDGEPVMMDFIDESYLEDLDISYNYQNIILPMVRLFVK